jgi:urea transport system permease protein
MAAMFLGVVLAFPDGLAGVYQTRIRPLLARLMTRKSRSSVALAAKESTPPVTPPAPVMPAGLSNQHT